MPLASYSARTTALVLAALCFGSGLALAWNYPIAPTGAALTFVAFVGFACLRPDLWLLLIPALLPVTGFASWTGWLTFEELDLLVLGAAAGGYGRIALRPETGATGQATAASSASGKHASRDAVDSATRRRHGRVRSSRSRRSAARVSMGGMALLGLFFAYSTISLYIGFHAARSMPLGWWHSYYDPLNSLRLFKSVACAVLLTPLIAAALARDEKRTLENFGLGAVLGLAFVSLSIVWERIAFPGLLDFSSDYRATALFWEMHVGGAALDGFLALTIPFAVYLLLRADTAVRSSVATIVLLLAVYGSLVTFSRGLYVAVAASVVVLAVLRYRQRGHAATGGASLVFKSALLIGFAAGVSFLVFRAGGYRSLAAILAVFAVMLWQSTLARSATALQWTVALGVGALLGAGGFVLAPLLPKGPYVVIACAFACCAALSLTPARNRNDWLPTAALSAFVWMMTAAAMVAWHWGGESALWDSLVAVAILLTLALWNARSRNALWPGNARTRGIVIGTVVLIAAPVALFTGGALMGSRFATSERDFSDRIQHWRDGVSLLTGPGEWLLGKGLGRFPENYFYGVPDTLFPGSYRLSNPQNGAYLSLGGPRHPIAFGELFRASQRVPLGSGGTYTVSLEARVPQAAELHMELCEKHLIYVGLCAIGKVEVHPSAAGWQRITLPLKGASPSRGPWYAPQLAFFSVAVETNGRLMEIDNVSLIGPDGSNLISNGDFSDGTARWFFTSDRHHLPWHIKNLFLHVLFEQGVIGLFLFGCLIVAGLWRVTQGVARYHPFAPYAAASLVGFLVVGVFDSLIDVPRVAVLFCLVLLLSLMMPRSAPRVSVAG